MNSRLRLLAAGLTALSIGASTGAGIAMGEESPSKLAGAARFDLAADDGTGAIENGQIVEGNGSIQRPNWLPEERQRGSYTANFPISHLGWREFSVRFTPASRGNVRLTLMGPWEEASKGIIYRQEVYWDELSAEGTAITNGSFENRLDGWQSGGGAIERQTKDLPALSGAHLARTWHNQTLSTNLQVRGGKPVTVRVLARAVRPAGFREMKRVTRRDTAAHQAARRFLRGANLGNGLEVSPGLNWGVHYIDRDIRQIRAAGFDHVRIPIGWHHYTGPGPEYRLKPEIFHKVDALATPALKEGLGVMINIHHFDDFTSSPSELAPKFYSIWRQIAEHYKNAPAGLVFELLNEPKDAATTEVVNPIFAEAVRQIRKTNQSRTIVLGPGRWNSIGELPKLRVPENDLNIVVTVHCYDPFEFTHQGADWAGNNQDRRLVGFVFPGPPETPLVPGPNSKLTPGFLEWIHGYNTLPAAVNPSGPRAIHAAVAQIKEWSDYYGRPVYLGEFGVYTTADPRSRANYYRTFRVAMEQAGIGWAIWDWKAGFRYWNEKTNRAEPGMHDALFGKVIERNAR